MGKKNWTLKFARGNLQLAVLAKLLDDYDIDVLLFFVSY